VAFRYIDISLDYSSSTTRLSGYTLTHRLGLVVPDRNLSTYKAKDEGGRRKEMLKGVTGDW